MASLADLLRSQNFGQNDSVILSAINHPLTAARKGADWFAGQANRAANIPDQYDNPNPLIGYTPEQQASGALNLAGLMQTSAFPFAPSGAGTLGSIKLVNKTANNRLTNIENYWNELGVKGSLGEKKGVITLEKIEVPHKNRNAGIGSKAMQSLIDYADETGKTIKLGASSQLGGDKSRLIDFYKRFGFEIDKKTAPVSAMWKDTSMTRTPQQIDDALMANVESNVPTTQELQNPAYMQQRSLNYMSPMAGAMKLSKELREAHKIAQKNATEVLGLPKNNTAMDRAKALGFYTQDSFINEMPKRGIQPQDKMQVFYHGGPENWDYSGFKEASGKSFYNPSNISGGYAFLTTKKGEGQGYANELALKNNIKTKVHEFYVRPEGQTKYIPTSTGNTLPSYKDLQEQGYGQSLVDLGKYGKGNDDNYYGHEWLLPYKPEQIRHISAAFDPLKIGSPHLLASTAGAFTLADLLNQDRNK